MTTCTVICTNTMVYTNRFSHLYFNIFFYSAIQALHEPNIPSFVSPFNEVAPNNVAGVPVDVLV
jgi:hypothetical protein